MFHTLNLFSKIIKFQSESDNGLVASVSYSYLLLTNTQKKPVHFEDHSQLIDKLFCFCIFPLRVNSSSPDAIFYTQTRQTAYDMFVVGEEERKKQQFSSTTHAHKLIKKLFFLHSHFTTHSIHVLHM